ncbi:DUF4430 domain-containing protein [Brevibacillus sp. H7]|uniref:DUF4430 domain-containing protein n=1 Tax=Brevibacillus sp. H7 TaxID=3349138 RepID=UPI0037F44FA1
MKKFWLNLLITVLLFTASMNGVGAAAGNDAAISANQTDEMIIVSGRTAPDDPEKVPLLITDAAGQIMYFRDVAGAGSSFAFEFVPPEETDKGYAAATLYSRNPVQSRFYVKVEKEEEKKKIDVTLRIMGYNGDEIFPKTKLKVTDGSSVFHLLQVASSEGDFDFEYEDGDGDGRDVYIKSIDGLAEFDKGPQSGWIYRVNGEGPQAPVDRYLLEPNDEVEILYTSDLGETEIGENDDGPRVSYARTESVSVEKALHRLQYAEDAEAIMGIVEDLLMDLANYEIDKQRTYLPEVAFFFQAAHERAAMLAVKKGDEKETVTVNLEAIDVKDLLLEQQKLQKSLEEELENSTLYKPLLNGLKPTLLIALPEKSDSQSWQLTVSPEAWERLTESGGRIAVTKQEWRSELLPARAAWDGKPLVIRFRFYDDKEQTDQLQTLQTADGSSPVPISTSVGISASHPQLTRLAFSWPLTGSVEDGSWPVLYGRADSSAAWHPDQAFLSIEGQQIKGETAMFGDLLAVTVQPVFHDLWELAPSYRWVQEPVTALASIGVVRGVAPGTFGMHQPVTADEFQTMLNRINGKGEALPADDRDAINRAEIAVLLERAYTNRAVAEQSGATPVFSDEAAIPQTAVSAVKLAAAKGWMKGRTDGRFDPTAGLTRGEAAAVLYRYWKDVQLSRE